MKTYARGAAVLLATAAAFATAAAPPKKMATVAPAASQPVSTLVTQRQKVSYLVGFDVAQSIAPVAPDLDLGAFERAVRNAFAGGKPMLTPEEAQKVGTGIMQRIAARNGQAPAGAPPAEVSKQQVGYLVGGDVGRSLSTIKDELDLAIVMQAMSTAFAKGPPLMTEAERNSLREAFSRDMRAKMEAQAAALSTRNKEEGARFLAENRTKKGVFTTPSGLQYMVLRQGSGARPRPSDRVSVNYHGTLLDGTVFDSSYDRGGQPADFMLNQVIQGWTEGVSMMPVGAKYRFWVPSELGYGERGAGGIGPNATLVFDVELLSVAQ